MPPLIRRPKGLTGAELGLAVAVGVISGIYIWRPLLIKYHSERKEKEKDEK